MLLNLSNHPSNNWDTKQIQLAEKLFGKIVDLPFPEINPHSNENEIYDLANEYTKKCKELLYKSKDRKNAVHIMGEMTFSFKVIELLKSEKITCIASTTKRKTLENKNTKITQFDFVKFREY